MKEEFKKDIEQGILLQGLKDLINSNTESMAKLINYNTKKSEASPSPSNDAGTVKVTKLTKPAKVPSWTKDMSLETYIKQLATWQDINKDVPEYVKYHNLIEELKRNKDIKGLLQYITDHILPVLIQKQYQSVEKVAGQLDS